MTETTDATIKAIETELDRLDLDEGSKGWEVMWARDNYENAPEDWVRVYDEIASAYGPAGEVLDALQNLPAYVATVGTEDTEDEPLGGYPAAQIQNQQRDAQTQETTGAHVARFWEALEPFENNERILMES